MRPLIESSASMTRPSWRRGVGGTHWLKQAKTTIISGMGGGSWWAERIGSSRFYTGFSRSASSPVLAKVLVILFDFFDFPQHLHALQVTDEVAWDLADFAFAGTLVVGVGV